MVSIGNDKKMSNSILYRKISFDINPDQATSKHRSINFKENIFCQIGYSGIQWTPLLTEQPQQQAAAAKKKDPF